jgi:hypothetical protein
MAKTPRSTARKARPSPQLYEFEVALLSGPLTREFARKNRAITRTIQILGNQTLEDLHETIFAAFDRYDEHLYEFQIGGKRPHDRNARRYGLTQVQEENDHDGDVTTTTIDSLGLKKNAIFSYWFDFGDDWWHQIDLLSIDDEFPEADYPRVIRMKGKSPPQYPNMEDEEEDE